MLYFKNKIINMKKTIKILAVISVIAATSLSTFAYKDVDCSSDPIFNANSCSQCFL
jgi:hypothetical protein